MITGLAIRNFKNLAAIPEAPDQLVPFGPLNLLIGPNGCGKSSLLQAIDFLRAFFASSVEVYLKERGWEYDDLPNLRQTTKTIRWELTAELDADAHGHGAGRYHYLVALRPRRYLSIGEERLTWFPKGTDAPQELLRRDGRQCRYLDRSTGGTRDVEMVGLPASLMSTWDPAEDRARFPEALRFREWVERFQLFLLWDPKVLREQAPASEKAFGPSGENLASVLAGLKGNHPESYQALLTRMKRLFPTFTGLEVEGSPSSTWTISQREGPDIVYNSQQMSDGILRLLAVTSLLYVDHPPSVVMFEEPENGVHPQLLREVVQVLRELTHRKVPNRCQVFLTSHSPYVLDEFIDHPEQVYCMERNQPQAGATLVRLSDRPQFRAVRKEYDNSLGEAWFSGLLGAKARD